MDRWIERKDQIGQTRLDQNMVQWKRRETERIVWSRVESRVEQSRKIEQNRQTGEKIQTSRDKKTAR